MATKHKQKKQFFHRTNPSRRKRTKIILIVFGLILVCIFIVFQKKPALLAPLSQHQTKTSEPAKQYHPSEKWLQRAYDIDALFHIVYTPCWEGAYGAIGDAYLFAATNDSSLLQFHLIDHDMRRMCVGTWVDDRAWICLAEMYWWNFTGRQNNSLILGAKQRYMEARNEGRLSNHEGFWSWYNWSPSLHRGERIFTNSNMNQMAAVACRLYEATGEKYFLDDALLVWNGNKKYPGIEKTLYHGNGKWVGRPGLAAFGKQLPWNGAEYCSIGAELYRVTKDQKYKKIVVETAKYIMNSDNGWVDPTDYYQIHMDGNGAFVNFLLDAYAIAPAELNSMLPKIEKMLEHVWTNNAGLATATLHRESDHGIRNGWNPHGGEDGYNVDEVGTVHAQGEAARAFGVFAYYVQKKMQQGY